MIRLSLTRRVAVIASFMSSLLITVAFAQAPSPSAYTDLEKAKLEIISLKTQMVELSKANSEVQAAYGNCQSLLGPLQKNANDAQLDKERATFVTDYEAGHPGFTIDPKTGGIVAKPVAVPAASPADDGKGSRGSGAGKGGAKGR